MGKTKMVELLDGLEANIDAGWRVPLVNRLLVDGYDLLEIIDQIRIALPDEIKQAELLLTEKERILGEARSRADEMLGSVKQQLAAAVNETEIVKSAKAEAAKILDEAKAEALQVRAGSDEYAENTLRNLEESLERALKVIKKGLEQLQSSQGK